MTHQGASRDAASAHSVRVLRERIYLFCLLVTMHWDNSLTHWTSCCTWMWIWGNAASSTAFCRCGAQWFQPLSDCEKKYLSHAALTDFKPMMNCLRQNSVREKSQKQSTWPSLKSTEIVKNDALINTKVNACSLICLLYLLKSSGSKLNLCPLLVRWVGRWSSSGPFVMYVVSNAMWISERRP